MSRGSTICSLVLLVCMLFVAGAVNAVGDALASPEARTDGIEWRPVSAEFGLVLTISGPAGFYWRQEVGPSGSPSFSVFDENGALRPAGSYVYELRAVPQIDAATRAELEAAREAGAGTVAKVGKVTEAQSGAFAIRDGAIVMGGDEEPGAGRPTGGTRLVTKDQVIPDDLIVQGSICAGFDCVNNENFGFDTIRLKENNTRIQFDDTSATTGFPTNNWQIRANSSASGGQNFLAFVDQGATGTSETGTILFQVTAGAPANSLVVANTGRVGLRTATPVLDLHIATSNTPGMRLEQTSAGGFTAQTWDVAGNEANFFVRSVTTGSQLPFRIRPGAPTSSIDIAANGDVGIGTASPSTSLHVVRSDATAKILVDENNGTAATRQLLELENNGNPQIRMEDTQAGGQAWAFTVGLSAFSISNFGVAGTQFQVDNNGDIRAQGNIFSGGTQLNVPDYVFEPDYALMPIEELEAYVTANRHLPNVPSADSIKAGGLNHSEFQMRLLEKIEELTLYTLQQHGYIEELQARIGTLEAGEAEGLDPAAQP